MPRYMLDTNTVSHLIKGHAAACRRLTGVPMAKLCISSVTEAELLFGLAKRPTAKRLHALAREFLLRVDALPWDCAERYGLLRAAMEQQGKILSPFDLLIATHALDADAILVTNDSAFGQVAGLSIEDWTIDF